MRKTSSAVSLIYLRSVELVRGWSCCSQCLSLRDRGDFERGAAEMNAAFGERARPSFYLPISSVAQIASFAHINVNNKLAECNPSRHVNTSATKTAPVGS